MNDCFHTEQGMPDLFRTAAAQLSCRTFICARLRYNCVICVLCHLRSVFVLHLLDGCFSISDTHAGVPA